MKHDIKHLHEQLTANLNDREMGKVLCSIAPAAGESGRTDEECICAFLSKTYELAISPAALKPLSRNDAIFIVSELLLGPVWGPRPKDRTDANNAADRFVAQFNEAARFFSTYTYKINRKNGTCSASGAALLESSFDMGIFAIDSNTVGILWMSDED